MLGLHRDVERSSNYAGAIMRHSNQLLGSFRRLYLILFFELLSAAISRAHGQTGEPPKIGLALSGGGPKGFAHIGVLEAIESRAINIDYIAGTSIGALVGAMYSIGYSVKDLKSLAMQLKGSKFLEMRCPDKV